METTLTLLGGGSSNPVESESGLPDGGSVGEVVRNTAPGEGEWDALTASDVGAQPVDSDLTAIAALTTTSYGRALLALADAAAGRTALGLGTAAVAATGDFQPIDSDLTAIAALTTTSFGRGLLTLADAAALLAAAGAQASDTDLTAIAALVSAANKLPYATGAGAWALTDFTAFARTLLDDADAATMLATLGAQPLDSDLTSIAALATTSYGRALLTLTAPASGEVPVYNATTGLFAPGSPKYDPKLSVYNLTETSLRRWRAQIAKALVSTTTPTRILCIGDSITEGTNGTTPYRTSNWPSRLRTLLGLDGRVGLVGENVVLPSAQTLANYDERWTLGSLWSKVGGSIDGMFQSAPGGGTLSFTVPSCDTITIYYVRHGINGTWTYNVDGGSATSVNANGATGILSTTFSVSLGTHTLNIIPHATTGYAMIAGIAYSTAAARNDIEVITGGGHTGSTSASWIGNNGFETLNMIDFLAPDLTFLCLGRNDANPSNGVSIAQFTTNMTTLIDRCRTTNNRDVVLVSPPPSSLGLYSNNAAMMAALYALADSKDVVLIDLARRFGTSWNASPYSLSSDDIHPNDAGQSALAQTVANVLLA